jgi:hypothetical protein
MAGVLSFSDYLGGPDNIQVEQIFPSTKRTYNYNFNQNITGWTFAVDYQTLVVNPVSYDRNGIPNFSASQVIGFFPKVDVNIDSSVVNVINAVAGTVNITIPGNMYTGALIPDARKNVPITIVGITWTTSTTPTQVNSHRWAFIQCYEPDVAIGNPILENNYTPFTVA